MESVSLTGAEIKKIYQITSRFVEQLYFSDKEAYALEKKFKLLTNPRYPVEDMFSHKVALKTTEYREPKAGEYYLSGAKPTAYRAHNDLITKYWIAKIMDKEG